jgi:hypothetical protein
VNRDDLQAILPRGYVAATGRGTERAFAQIIPPSGASWFAIAQDEDAAIRKVLAEMREDRRK